MSALDPGALSLLYRWIDTVPLDRPKKNISRDFSDGVLMSQVMHYFFPKLVELHNYSASNSVDQKNYNWKTLNQKVFKKMGFMISPVDIEAVVACKKHAIERILLLIQAKIGEYQQETGEEPQHALVVSAPTPAPVATPAAAPKMASPKAQPAQLLPPQAAGKSRKSQAATPAEHKSQSPVRKAAAATPAAASSVTLPKISGGGGGGESAQQTMNDLRDTVDILQLKVQKLEQLLRLKNAKIDSLTAKLQDAGL